MYESIASIAASAEHALKVLQRADPRLILLVAATALAGWLIGAVVGSAARRVRSRLGRQLLTDLRLPLTATIGLSGLLWVTSTIHADLCAFILVPLGICWVLGAGRVLGHVIGWVVTRAAAPWKLEEERAEHEVRAPTSDRERFGERIGQEISRVRDARGEPAATVVAVGLKVGGLPQAQGQAQIWQLAWQAARHQDVLHRDGDGTVLALLPDASGAEVERWLATLSEAGPDTAVGRATFPADGDSVEELLDRAVTRMWLDQGAAPGELISVSSPRHRSPFVDAEDSCIPLLEEDMVDVKDVTGLKGLDLGPHFNFGSRSPSSLSVPVPVVPAWSPEGSSCG